MIIILTTQDHTRLIILLSHKNSLFGNEETIFAFFSFSVCFIAVSEGQISHEEQILSLWYAGVDIMADTDSVKNLEYKTWQQILEKQLQ